MLRNGKSLRPQGPQRIGADVSLGVCGEVSPGVMGEHVDEVLRQACLAIEKRWEIRFLEIGLDRDHVHFSSNRCRPTVQRASSRRRRA